MIEESNVSAVNEIAKGKEIKVIYTFDYGVVIVFTDETELVIETTKYRLLTRE